MAYRLQFIALRIGCDTSSRVTELHNLGQRVPDTHDQTPHVTLKAWCCMHESNLLPHNVGRPHNAAISACGAACDKHDAWCGNDAANPLDCCCSIDAASVAGDVVQEAGEVML